MENRLLKNKGLKNLLDAFDMVHEDIHDLLRYEGLVSPERLMDYLVDQSTKIEDSRKELFKQHFKSGITRDDLLGAYANSMSALIDDIAQECSAIHEDTFTVEIDISNMGNTNDAIGMDKVDKSTRIISHYYEEEIEKLGGTVQTLRKGGDEIRYYTQGISEEDLQKALQIAGQRASEFSWEMKTEKLLHSKLDSPPGFDVGAGYVRTTKGAVAEVQQAALETQMYGDKSNKGDWRESVKGREVSSFDAALLTKTDYDPKLIEQAEKIARTWNSARGIVIPQSLHKKANKDRFTPEDFHSEPQQKMVANIIDKELGKLGLDKPIQRACDYPQELQCPLEPEDNAEDKRATKAIEYANDNSFAQGEKDLLLAGASFYNDRCAITGLRGYRDYVADSDRIKESEQEPKITTVFALENLSGLNSSLNTKKGDYIIAEYADIVQKNVRVVLGDEVAEQLYRIDAGRVAFNTVGIDFQTLQQLSAKIATEMEEKLNDITFVTYEDKNDGHEVYEVQSKKERSTKNNLAAINIVYPNNQDTYESACVAERDEIDAVNVSDVVYAKTPEENKARKGVTLSAIIMDITTLSQEVLLNTARIIKDVISERQDIQNPYEIAQNIHNTLDEEDRRLTSSLDYATFYSAVYDGEIQLNMGENVIADNSQQLAKADNREESGATRRQQPRQEPKDSLGLEGINSDNIPAGVKSPPAIKNNPETIDGDKEHNNADNPMGQHNRIKWAHSKKINVGNNSAGPAQR